MKRFKHIIQITAIFVVISGTLWAQPTGKEILDKIDANMSSDTRYVKSKMVIHGPRSSRTVESESWAEGKSGFTEYLAPAREKGTKMLKLEDKLWIFSPPQTEPYRSPVICCVNQLWDLTSPTRT